LDRGSAEEASENIARPIENNKVKKNPGEKRVYIAKRLGLAASTLNTIFAKDEIRQQTEKCCNACKKRTTGKESTFAELETVLFTWYQ
jgi:2-hydroxychromene-2-carboxylate isomerase